MDVRILGIDAGSVAVSAVEMDRDGQVRNQYYALHEGRPLEALATALESFRPSAEAPPWCAVATTRSAAGLLSEPEEICDDHVALMTAAGRIHGKIGSLLTIGGEKFGLFTWDGEGEYRSFKGNTSCAAGTGGFLDQQAERLGLASAAELADMAEAADGEIPKIATRCAVFAKTDLTHAQQEGFDLNAIADGLCRGLAGNLLDVLLDGTAPAEPLIVCGGVSRNPAVVRHIGELTGTSPTVDAQAPLYGALGAAWKWLEKLSKDEPIPRLRTRAEEVLAPPKTAGFEGFRYPPLELKLSEYPDFQCADTWEVPVEDRKGRYPVEVEIFEELPPSGHGVLGIDIGSTSTKAVVITEDDQVLLGLYTRTAGRPIEAMKALLMALEGALEKYNSKLTIEACATTGSGRKLVGEVLGADLILDEITAHARAAVELDPKVDTIIEIGGQDAKFTTLSGGRVTASIMNNVCAAGTGSFLEEQAARLGCGVRDYARRTDSVSAPLSSDRCTVFMQRDLNHLLTEGCEVDQVLAAALHSVRENYLNKVAVRNRIGSTIFFQGATARIRTLVAAFEQALGKPILVSRFCSHTGALGAALQLADERREEVLSPVDEPVQSRFRGVGLWRSSLPVHTETCELCRNACKITVAEVEGETVAYGFLCGRDYQTQRFVSKAGRGSEPLDERRRMFRPTADPGDLSSNGLLRSLAEKLHIPGLPRTAESTTVDPGFSLGLPAALYMAGDLPFWEMFFALLGIQVTSDTDTDPIEAGRALTGAEFCAPMTALHGRVARLLEKADYVFMPFYMDEKDPSGGARAYCYYSQFAPSLIKQAASEERIIAPVVKTSWNEARGPKAVREALAQLGPLPNTRAFENAWKIAKAWHDEKRAELGRFYEERAREDDVNIVLLGRPYVVADAEMNKDIPRLFTETGVRVFDMEMLGPNFYQSSKNQELPWNYASQIMEAAERIAGMEGAYPVLITSFMCSPDSFALPYVREIWEKKGKPYLVLELDGHGSSVGYGTRVEAAVRSFRNHRVHSHKERTGTKDSPVLQYRARKAAEIRNKTLLLPNWDSDVISLLAANLRREGIDARVLEESDRLVREGSRKSDGQCLPLSVIAREVAAYVKKHNLDPAKTALWMLESDWVCNIPLFPKHIHHLLAQEGGGMEKVTIYVEDIGFTSTTPLAFISTYYAYMFGGLLKRIACRIRPYEINPGETDRVANMSRDLLVKIFLGRGDRMEAVKTIVSRFEAIPVDRSIHRPKVAIFGDVYVRDNEVMNQDLIRFIEQSGGEVITMPYNRYAKMVAETHFARLSKEKRYKELAVWKLFLAAVKVLEKSYDELFTPLAGPEESYPDDPAEILAPYGVTPEHHGESMENLLKIHYLANRHDDMALLVQTSPSFCCAGLITEAMRRRIEEVTSIPVICITYDGTGGNKNDAVVPYLAFPRNQPQSVLHPLQKGTTLLH